MSTERGEDEAWRSIVDNYGERPSIEDESDAGSTSSAEPVAEPPVAEEPEQPEERFVPPVPAPAPRRPLPQRLAWFAVLGSPALLVLAMLVAWDLPAIVGYALVAAFVGGFCYLVLTMQRSDQRDPWDDGAQL